MVPTNCPKHQLEQGKIQKNPYENFWIFEKINRVSNEVGESI